MQSKTAQHSLVPLHQNAKQTESASIRIRNVARARQDVIQLDSCNHEARHCGCYQRVAAVTNPQWQGTVQKLGHPKPKEICREFHFLQHESLHRIGLYLSSAFLQIVHIQKRRSHRRACKIPHRAARVKRTLKIGYRNQPILISYSAHCFSSKRSGVETFAGLSTPSKPLASLQAQRTRLYPNPSVQGGYRRQGGPRTLASKGSEGPTSPIPLEPTAPA